MQMIFNRDLSNLCEECQLDKKELIKTAASLVLLVAMFSLMGWAFLPKYNTTPPAPTLTMEQMTYMPANELARWTAEINAEMERRTK
jgi:hypothetical protein